MSDDGNDQIVVIDLSHERGRRHTAAEFRKHLEIARKLARRLTEETFAKPYLDLFRVARNLRVAAANLCFMIEIAAPSYERDAIRKWKRAPRRRY
jgi:hypothetical protein